MSLSMTLNLLGRFKLSDSYKLYFLKKVCNLNKLLVSFVRLFRAPSAEHLHTTTSADSNVKLCV